MSKKQGLLSEGKRVEGEVEGQERQVLGTTFKEQSSPCFGGQTSSIM